MYTSVNPSFTIKKMGFKVIKMIQVCFRDVLPVDVLSTFYHFQKIPDRTWVRYFLKMVKRAQVLDYSFRKKISEKEMLISCLSA